MSTTCTATADCGADKECVDGNCVTKKVVNSTTNTTTIIIIVVSIVVPLFLIYLFLRRRNIYV